VASLGSPHTRTSPVTRPAVLRPASTSMHVVLPAPDEPCGVWSRVYVCACV
jgi:hypothetical protein